MATIRIRKGRLFLDYYDSGGKRHRKALHLDKNRENMSKARIEKKKLEYELEAGIHIERKRRVNREAKSLCEGFEEFIGLRKNLSVATIESYNYSFKNVVNLFGDAKIRDIDEAKMEQLERLLKTRISENSVASYFNKLKVIFEYFKSQRYIEVNPVPDRQMKIEEPLAFERKQIEDILSKLKKKNRKHYRVVALLTLTGMRISELLRLSFDDIDFKENIMVIRNTKGRREDKFPLYEELREFLLNEFPNREGFLFDYKSKDSMKFFKKFLIKEGYFDYNFHNLRKTFISKLVNSGMNVFDVMKLARHRNINTTLKHYTASELARMGDEITRRANMGTFLGTLHEKPLKLVEKAKKMRDVA